MNSGIKKIIFISLLFLAIAIASGGAFASSVPLKIYGDKIILSSEKVVATGNARLEYKDVLLKADYIELDPKTWELFATGNVLLVEDKNTLSGERFTLSVKEDTFKLEKAKGELTESDIKGFIYIKGDSIQKEKSGTIISKEASFTTCDLPQPHYHIEAKELVIYPQERLYAVDVSFYLGDTLLFSLPYYSIIFDYPERQPIIPEIGTSPDKGMYLRAYYSHYQSKDLYGYAQFDVGEKTGFGFGLTEFYNIKNIGPGYGMVYVLPSLDEIKTQLSLNQEAKFGDVNLSTYLNRTNILEDRWDYRILASNRGHSISYYGYQNNTTQVSSNIVNLTSSNKIGDVNTTLNIRDREYVLQGNSSEITEYRLTGNTTIQNISIRGEIYTVSYPNLNSFSQFGYMYILTKSPEISLSSKVLTTPYLNINAETVLGNYIEYPDQLQGVAIKGALSLYPKSISLLDGNLNSSLSINGSYYPPQDYISGITSNIQWSKDLSKDLSLKLSYDYRNGWGNSQFNILSERPFLPLNTISGVINLKGDNYSANLTAKFDILSLSVSPIVLNGNWKQDDEHKISLSLSINPYNLSDISAVSYISWRLNPKWKVDTRFNITHNLLQFQDMKITYDLHCWEANISYNIITQSISLGFSLKAFPTIGTTIAPGF
ncbi:MAG: hypothetical protein ACP5PC_02420 [bacterium]